MLACAPADPSAPDAERLPQKIPAQNGQAEKPPVESSPVKKAGADITYIGNEGVLIVCAGRKILIDSLYREGLPGYVAIPPERQELMETGKPPFDDIDLVLTTHIHADHFDPQAVGRYLTNNPQARFISTRQVVDSLRDNFASFDAIEERVRGRTPSEGLKLQISMPSIRVVLMNMHHGRDSSVENLGFLIKVEDMTFLHVGDTQSTQSDYAQYDLPSEKIDVAFLPFYQLVFDVWRKTVEETIGARRMIAVHLPPPGVQAEYIENLGGRDKIIQQIKDDFPGTLVLDREMETVTVTASD